MNISKVVASFRHGLLLAAIVGSIVFTLLSWFIEWWMISKEAGGLSKTPILSAALLVLLALLINLATACFIYFALSERVFKDIKAIEAEADGRGLAQAVANKIAETYRLSAMDLRDELAKMIETKLDTWKRSGIEEFSRVNNPPWDDWISSAATIHICVQGWEDWIVNHEGAWVTFFQSGGTVTLYLPDPDDPLTLKVIGERLPDRTVDERKSEIKNTYRKLRYARRCAGNQGHIVHRQLRRMNWYCAVLFDDQGLFLSPYEHVRVTESSVGPTEPRIKSPSYKVPLQGGLHDLTRRWIQKEFEGLATDGYSIEIEHPSMPWDGSGDSYEDS